MEWLKSLLKSLPLESISEVLAKIVLWWTRLVEGVPEAELSLWTYVGGSVLVLILLYWVLKILPKALRGIVWILSAAILLTPGSAMGEAGGTAPAIIDAFYHLLMGETALALTAMLPILAVAIAGLVLVAIWQLLRAILLARQESQVSP